MNCLADIPWTALIGIAGIVGTLTAAHLANASAERRQRQAEWHEDRTRFHKERAELYARFLLRSKEHAEAAVNAVAHGLAKKAIPSTPRESEILERWRNAWTTLEETGTAIQLMSTEPVRAAADDAMRAADALFKAGRSAEDLPPLEATRQKAMEAFKDAARAELFPNATVSGS
jgi:hypothetical protein